MSPLEEIAETVPAETHVEKRQVRNRLRSAYISTKPSRPMHLQASAGSFAQFGELPGHTVTAYRPHRAVRLHSAVNREAGRNKKQLFSSSQASGDASALDLPEAPVKEILADNS